MATKQVKQRVEEEFAQHFRPYYGKQLQVQISTNEFKPFSSTLEVVRIATLEMMKGLTVDKRDGKSPSCIVVEFKHGKLFFVMDDVKKLVLGVGQLILRFEDYDILFKEVK